ncbi:hypothetical protein JCM9279_004269 [Rhodotorula babjevae]
MARGRAKGKAKPATTAQSTSAAAPPLVAGPSTIKILDIDALIVPPPTLSIHSRAMHAHLADALASTGASIQELQPQINQLVTEISRRLLAAKDEHELLSLWLLGLHDVVSPELEGEALADWTVRLSRAGGDVVSDEGEMEREAVVSASAIKGKGKAAEARVGDGWMHKARDSRARIDKSVDQEEQMARDYTPYGSRDAIPYEQAQPITSLSSQLIRTTALRFFTHSDKNGNQLEPGPRHDRVDEIRRKVVERAHASVRWKTRGGRFGPSHLENATKWARKAWPDPIILYGPEPLPPPATEADHICPPYRPVAAAAAQAPPSTTAAPSSSSSTRLATSIGAAAAAAAESDTAPQHGAAPAPPANPSADQAKAAAPAKKPRPREPLRPVPAAAAESTSDGGENDRAASEIEQEERVGKEGKRAVLEPTGGRDASSRRTRPARAAAAQSSSTSSDDEREASEAEHEQQGGASEGERAALRPAPGGTASSRPPRPPRRAAVIESSSSDDDDAHSSSSEGDRATAAPKHGRAASRRKGRAPRRVAVAAASPTSNDDKRDGSASEAEHQQQDGASEGERAALRPAPGDAASRGKGRASRRLADVAVTSTSGDEEQGSASSEDERTRTEKAPECCLHCGASLDNGRAARPLAATAAAATSGDDKRDGSASEAEHGQQDGASKGERAALRPTPGDAASSRSTRPPRVAAVQALPSLLVGERQHDEESRGAGAEMEPPYDDSLGEVPCVHAAAAAGPSTSTSTSTSSRTTERAALPGFVVLGGSTARGAPRASRDVVARGARRASNGVEPAGGHGGGGDNVGKPSSVDKVGEPSSVDKVGEPSSAGKVDETSGFLKMRRVPGLVNYDLDAPYNCDRADHISIPAHADPRLLEIGRLLAALAEIPPEERGDVHRVVNRIVGDCTNKRARLGLPSLDQQNSLLQLARPSYSDLWALVLVLQQQQVSSSDAFCSSKQKDLEDRLHLLVKEHWFEHFVWSHGSRPPVHNGHGKIVGWLARDGVIYDAQEGGAPSSGRRLNIDVADLERHTLERRRVPWFMNDGLSHSSPGKLSSSSSSSSDESDTDDSIEIVKGPRKLGVAGSSRSQQSDDRAAQVAPSVASEEEYEESEAEAAQGPAAEEPDEEVREDARHYVPARRRARSRFPALPEVEERSGEEACDLGDESTLVQEMERKRWSDEEEA